MNTSLSQIKAFHPCASGWKTLLTHLGKLGLDDEALSLKTILESNGLDDALWALRSCPEALPLIGAFASRCAQRAKTYAGYAARYAAAAARYADAAGYAAAAARYAGYAARYAAGYAADAGYAAERLEQESDFLELFCGEPRVAK
jgi:hypothetical protein